MFKKAEKLSILLSGLSGLDLFTQLTGLNQVELGYIELNGVEMG